MSRDPLLRELFSGFIRFHILFHVADVPVYGTALMAELERHGYQVGPGTLYPVLHLSSDRAACDETRGWSPAGGENTIGPQRPDDGPWRAQRRNCGSW
jgi:hypothetical protein